jgi:hypothetical protein
MGLTSLARSRLQTGTLPESGPCRGMTTPKDPPTFASPAAEAGPGLTLKAQDAASALAAATDLGKDRSDVVAGRQGVDDADPERETIVDPGPGDECPAG